MIDFINNFISNASEVYVVENSVNLFNLNLLYNHMSGNSNFCMFDLYSGLKRGRQEIRYLENLTSSGALKMTAGKLLKTFYHHEGLDFVEAISFSTWKAR